MIPVASRQPRPMARAFIAVLTLGVALPALADDVQEPPPPLTDRDRYEQLQEQVMASDRFKESRLKSVMTRAQRALTDDVGDRDETLRRLRRSYRAEVEHLARRFRTVRADVAQFDDAATAMLLNTAFTDYAAAFEQLGRGNASRAATLLRRADDHRREAEDRMSSAPRRAPAPVTGPPAR